MCECTHRTYIVFMYIVSYRLRQNDNSKRNSGTNAGNKRWSRDSHLVLLPPPPPVFLFLRLVKFSFPRRHVLQLKRKKVIISNAPLFIDSKIQQMTQLYFRLTNYGILWSISWHEIIVIFWNVNTCLTGLLCCLLLRGEILYDDSDHKICIYDNN